MIVNKFATASPLLGGRSLPSINAGLKEKVTPHMGKFIKPPSMDTIGAAAGMLSGASSMYEGIMGNLNAPDVELMNMQAQNKNDLLNRGNQFTQQGGYANQLGKTNVAGSALSMAGTGAAAGMALGPLGAAIGGGIGAIGGAVSSIFGNSKRRKKEREAFLKTQREFAGTNNLISTNEISQWQGNQLAYGGILPMTQQVNDILQTRGNNIFDDGGSLPERALKSIKGAGISLMGPLMQNIKYGIDMVDRLKHAEPSKTAKKTAGMFMPSAATAAKNLTGMTPKNTKEPAQPGGGRMSGAGAGFSWGNNDFFARDSIFVNPYIPIEHNFKDAFANANKQGLDTFQFQGKPFHTQRDTTNTIDHDAVARRRTEMRTIPLDTTYLHDVNVRHSNEPIQSQNDTIGLPLPLATKYDENAFAYGGQFDNGVNSFGVGGTHEESPYGGIPVGMGENGEPNLVEEGEVKWNDFIFSDRIIVEDVEGMHLPKNLQGMTFAEAALEASKESEERPYNSISRRGLEDSLGKLAALQEYLKEMEMEEEQQIQENNTFATGGNLFAGGGNLGGNPVTSGGNIEQGIIQELQDAYIRAGIDNPDMIKYLIAQDELESRFTPQGKHNYSNITGGKGYKGKTVTGNDHNAKGEPITQSFREYDTVDDYVKDKIALLKRRYDFDANDTAEVFASKLDGNNKSKFRWAEDPKYGEKMINMFGGDFNLAPAGYRKEYLARQADDNITSTTEASVKDKGKDIKDIDVTFASDNNTMYAGIANNVSANASNPIAVPPIQEREQSQVDTNSGGNDYLRYAPVVSQLGSLAGLYGERPDTLNLGRMSATHLQDRMQYNPMDSDYITNQIRQQGANTNNAIMDSSGGNRGVAQAGLLASNRGIGDAIGDSMFRMAEYNNQNRQQVQEFNKHTNMFNAQQDMQVAQANLNMQAQEQMYNKQAQAALSNAKRQAFAGIGTTLGQIGTENRFMRIAPKVSGGYDSEGNYIGYKKAMGGPLNKFYKKKIK